MSSAVLVFLLLAVPSLATAQATRAGFTMATLRAGDSIYITRTSGEKVQGSVAQVSATELTLDNGTRLTIDDVLKIDRRGDSLKNGATIGAMILGGLCLLNCGDAPVLAVAMNAGLGALLGAFIDHDHVGRTTIYQRSPSLRMSPVVTPNQRSVTLTISY